jgi:hypothetical protein
MGCRQSNSKESKAENERGRHIDSELRIEAENAYKVYKLLLLGTALTSLMSSEISVSADLVRFCVLSAFPRSPNFVVSLVPITLFLIKIVMC